MKKNIRSINDLRSMVVAKRRESGITQTEVAKLTGVSRKWISSFEKGSSKAELELVLRLIFALGLELEVRDGSPGLEPYKPWIVEGSKELLEINLTELMIEY